MLSGTIVGYIRKDVYTIIVLEDKERETTVNVCGHPAILPGDFLWTQSGWAMWTQKDCENRLEDFRLPIHRVYFDGSFGCNKSIEGNQHATDCKGHPNDSIARKKIMSLEAWGDCDPAVRECPSCDGIGEWQDVIDSLLVYWPCPRCNGTGEVPDEYDPLPDDVI